MAHLSSSFLVVMMIDVTMELENCIPEKYLQTQLLVGIQCLKVHQNLLRKFAVQSSLKTWFFYNMFLKNEFVEASEVLCAFESPRYSNIVKAAQ